MESVPRKKIGKYEIAGVQGRGGMGVVYRAEDPMIGRSVAIKTLNESLSGQPEMLKRFYREAQAPLHPNIAIVFDVGDEDGKPFIVMEFVEGDGLDKIIGSDRPIPLIDKLTIISQVCAGLGYAHQNGVVHRDIKPANIMVKRNPIQAKIVDFGIASVQRAKMETGLTQTGKVIGTVHYISPERLRGNRGDGRADIWATGVMLYLLLTGQLPFPGAPGEELSVMNKVIHEPHPPLSTWMENYPPALDAIIDRALAKDPEDRYPAAEELAADLNQVIDELKRGQVGALFADAERLAAEQEFGRARDILHQLVSIEPSHTSARNLLSIVNQNLSKLQRAEQMRQLLAEAEEAIAAARFSEAMSLLDQAAKREPGNTDITIRLESAKKKKRVHEEVATLIDQVESLRASGNWTAAVNVAEQALKLDGESTEIRALFMDISRQAKLAEKQGQIREMLGKANKELSVGHFTDAMRILRQAGQIDPSHAEIERLLQVAASGQEQEQRRKLIEQVHTEIQRCLTTQDPERAMGLVDSAIQRMPNEPTLLQLRARVAIESREIKNRKLIDSTVSKAQDLMLTSPVDALMVVQSALQELPGEERLRSFETTLRQRLKSAEKEQIKGRYLREAQEAIEKGKFDKAVETLESYQLDFSDVAGVEKLLEFARSELDRQHRQERVAALIAEASPLMESGQYTSVIRLLEPASAETGDSALKAMIGEARAQQTAQKQKIEAMLTRAGRLREQGQLTGAIELLEGLGAAPGGSQVSDLLNELRNEQKRKQATQTALATVNEAVGRADFHAAIEALESVQRAWGESAEISGTLAQVEARRRDYATRAVSKAIEQVRAALLANDNAAALKELRASAEMVEFAAPAQQADWRRLNVEASKSKQRKRTAPKDVVGGAGPGFLQTTAGRAAIGGGVLILAVAVLFWLHPWAESGAKPAEQANVQPAQPSATPSGPAVPVPVPAANVPTGNLLLHGSPGGANVFVDGVLKGFTENDGSLKLPLDPGNHSIRYSKSGFNDVTASVAIRANTDKPMTYTLAPAAPGTPVAPKDVNGYLTVQSNPGAKVSIDSANRGTTDARGELILTLNPGIHTLVIAQDGYQALTRTLNVNAGERNNLMAGLTAIPRPAPTPTPVAPEPVRIDSFSASAAQIQQGQPTTLTWRTANASEVTIDGIGNVDASNSTILRPSKTTTYTLTAKGNGGTQQRSLTVMVEAAPAPAPTPVPTPAPTPAPAPVADPRAPIQAAVNAFVAAFNAHNTGAMHNVWVTMTAKDIKSFQDTFSGLPTISMTENCQPGSLIISGDSADWTCTETTKFLNNGKPETTPPHSVHFGFARKGGAWVISSR